MLFYLDIFGDCHVLLPGTWDYCSMGLLSVWCVKPAGVLWLWHLQVPNRTAELTELRHFQENTADQGHFRSVLVIVKSALV